MVAELGFYRGRRRRAGESSHRRSPPAALGASSLPVPRPTRGSRGSGSRVTTPIPGPPGQGHDAEDGESDFSIALLDSAGADALPPGVDLSVFDMGVNAGIWRSARLLQQALGFTGEEVDGSIGPETLAAADRFDARNLVNNLADRQTAYYRSLANFPIFGTGWLRRTAARRDAALAMIQSETTVAA